MSFYLTTLLYLVYSVKSKYNISIKIFLSASIYTVITKETTNDRSFSEFNFLEVLFVATVDY